jgi:hypothetical protein
LFIRLRWETARLGEQDRIFGSSPGSHAVLDK